MKFWSKYKTFHSRICIWKYHLWNGAILSRGGWVKILAKAILWSVFYELKAGSIFYLSDFSCIQYRVKTNRLVFWSSCFLRSDCSQWKLLTCPHFRHYQGTIQYITDQLAEVSRSNVDKTKFTKMYIMLVPPAHTHAWKIPPFRGFWTRKTPLFQPESLILRSNKTALSKQNTILFSLYCIR